ncbi:MAG: DUF6960 family protein [Limnobaculum xujianqingii]
MAKSKCVGTYGLYPWFPEHGENFINPLYIDTVKKLSLYGKVFSCISEDETYITLKYGDVVFEVKPDLYQFVNNTLFNIGNAIVVTNSSPNKVGIVIEIHWHYKNSEPIYYLTFGGKKHLVAISNQI